MILLLLVDLRNSFNQKERMQVQSAEDQKYYLSIVSIIIVVIIC